MKSFIVVLDIKSCDNCPYVENRGFNLVCSKAQPLDRSEVFRENMNELTESCPMWKESKDYDLRQGNFAF